MHKLVKKLKQRGEKTCIGMIGIHFKMAIAAVVVIVISLGRKEDPRVLWGLRAERETPGLQGLLAERVIQGQLDQ